jgi:hypothetical protein
VDSSFPTGTVKEEDRDEKKFRAFKARSYLSFSKIFIPSIIISSISNFSTFWSSRAPKVRYFFLKKTTLLAKAKQFGFGFYYFLY